MSDKVAQLADQLKITTAEAQSLLASHNGDVNAALDSRKKQSRFMSFSQLDNSNNDEDDEGRNTFAGGETSGLEVTDPNDSNSLIRDLLEKAKRGAQNLTRDEPTNDSFTGTGYRLGASLGESSQTIKNPTEQKPKKVTREITFWKEGFQVGDGELYRYDDSANSFYLSELNQGRAPLNLLDVEFGQEVDVNVYKKLDESYKAPKKKAGGFLGQGQRLGSPIPGESGATPQPQTAQSSETGQNESKEEELKEETKGDSSVQIRYATGKREIYRCNASDTVQSLYDYVNSNTNDTRGFTLNYSFPVQPLEDYSATIKAANLVNAVVVQRWV